MTGKDLAWHEAATRPPSRKEKNLDEDKRKERA
jgi:hypothetical protein